MSIWIIVWIILAVALFYFTAWTFFILQRQKKSWKAFASKYKMRYVPNGVMESPGVNGVVDGYTVGIFMGEHMSPDARRARKLSAIEINLHSVMPTDGAVGSADMVALIQGLGFKTEIKPDYEDWNDDYIASTDKKAVMQSYLTSTRVSALCDLMKIKNSAVILIFRDEISLLRFDTPDPLDKPQKLDKLIKKMIKAAKILEAPELSTVPLDEKKAEGGVSLSDEDDGSSADD